MSEMAGPSADGGSNADAPTSVDQPSAADDLTAGPPEQPPENTSAPSVDGPPSADPSKLPEPGKASAPPSADAPQAAGTPGPAPLGKASGPADGSSSPAGGQTVGGPKPPPPGKASAADTQAEPKVVSVMADGTMRLQHPDGAVLQRDPDGTSTFTSPDGSTFTLVPGGPVAASTNARLRVTADGGMVGTTSDGYTVTASHGNVTVMSPDRSTSGITRNGESWASGSQLLLQSAQPVPRATNVAVPSPLTPSLNRAGPRVASVDHAPTDGWLVGFDRPVTVEQTGRFLWPSGVPDTVQIRPVAPDKVHVMGLNIDAVQRMTPEVANQIVSLTLTPVLRGDPAPNPSPRAQQPSQSGTRTHDNRAPVFQVGDDRHHVAGPSAKDVIDTYTSFMNLDEEALGGYLLGRVRAGEFSIVREVLDELGSTNRDDVALAFMEAATDTDVATLVQAADGRALLDRCYDELTSGSVADDEQRQADRILAAQSKRISPQDFEDGMQKAMVFPYKLSGTFTGDDAPIHAELREGGKIWVELAHRVLINDDFRETQTLRSRGFISGMELSADEIVGIKMYDLGGGVVYRPALYLIQLSNESTMHTLGVAGEAFITGLTLGSGALAAEGSTVTARALLAADRIAFAVGTIHSISLDQRNWISERFGDKGRTFLDYLDKVNSVVEVYGRVRAIVGMGKLVSGLAKSLSEWRVAAAATEARLPDGERQLLKQVDLQADELLKDIRTVQGEPEPRVTLGTAAPTPGGKDAPPELSSKLPEGVSQRAPAATPSRLASPPESVPRQAPVTLTRTAGPEIWEELAKELETTPTTSLPNWTIPGNWSSAKPSAYKFIFGEKTLPEINRPGNIQMTLGHIVEKATGGTHSLDNLMPQLNKVNVRLSGIYGRKPFALPLPNGEMKVIEAINGKAINGSLREALESGRFSIDEQRAISYFVTSMVTTPELEAELADLIRKIPKLQGLVP